MRFILASKSPARLHVLRRAGLNPEVIVSGFDESQITDSSPSSLAARLAEFKGSAVLPDLHGDYVLLSCDSVLEFEGKTHGKPGSKEKAIALWHRMRGHSGLLHTGHFVATRVRGVESRQVRVGTTSVSFADVSDEEIEAYAATGEPQRVAGGFSIDGIGGAFITTIEGDPFNVIGVSLPLVRQMVIDAGVPWHSLWPQPGTAD